MMIGLLMLANATGKPNIEQGSTWQEYVAAMNKYTVTRHIIWFGLGCVLAGIIMYFDYQIYGNFSVILYIMLLFLLVGVRILVQSSWSVRWEIANQEIQPRNR